MSDKLKILLVDDDARYRELYREALSAALDVEVLFAGSGEEALKALAAEDPPDLVLLDLDMPKLRGEEVLKRIKHDVRLRFIPVIILTGDNGFEKQIALLGDGADDFIAKGTAPELLVARIKAQMRHKLAVDRLDRVALERDLFAAGVLSDIGNIKWAILGACRHVKATMKQNPKDAKRELAPHLEKLTTVARRLGSYASDVIQSVRDTSRKPVLQSQDVAALCTWVKEIMEDGTGTKVTWSLPEKLSPVLADKNFMRLAWLNVVQFCAQRSGGGELKLAVRQSLTRDPSDPLGRSFVSTMIADEGPVLSERDLNKLFAPSSLSDSSVNGLGLALVAKVMAKMSGRAVAAHSDLGIAIKLELPLGN